MDDLISRQAAIDAVSSLCDDCDSDYCGSCRVNYPGEKDVIKALKDLPSAQPEPHDLVSRRAALEAMDTWDKFGCDPDGKLVRYDDDKHYIPYVHYEDMVHAVKNLPPAQPEPQWIPVSERLPEKGGEYLVSVHHTIGAISVFHPEKDTYVDDVAIMKYYGKFPSTVRAWMPLPEAYKGDEK